MEPVGQSYGKKTEPWPWSLILSKQTPNGSYFHIKAKNCKISRSKYRTCLYLGLGKDILDKTPKAKTVRENDTLEFIKIITFAFLKALLRNENTRLRLEENICQPYIA